MRLHRIISKLGRNLGAWRFTAKSLVLSSALALPWPSAARAQDAGAEADAGDTAAEAPATPEDAAAPAGEPDAGASPSAAANSPEPPPEVSTPTTAEPPVALVPLASPEPPAAPDPPATREPPAVQVPIEVTVRARISEVQRLQESAEAVTIVDVRKAHEQAADMGELLARTQGVAVRRDGGLGSNTRFSLNGLYDDQIRFFLDGVPLELAGYPFGVANVPVNLVHRVEIYRGVVPIRLGADALGGVVNLVTSPKYETHLGASYQPGSFGTHRLTLDGRYRHEPTGFVIGGAGFFDSAVNDYRVDVEIPDERGRPMPATVRRFHDGYRAYGGNVEAGFLDRKWADRLLVKAFAATYDKDRQHNLVMTVPYGEVEEGESVYGATVNYDLSIEPGLKLEVVGNYSHRRIDFVDKGKWVYDWNGERIRERPRAGEIESKPTDQTTWQDTGFGRATLNWEISAKHSLGVSVSPTFAARTGDERIQADPNGRDPLSAKRDLFTFVSGLEYELNLFADRLSNVAFFKDYVYRANTEEVLPGNIFRARDRDSHTQGVGDSLRYRFTPWLYAKASYEYATRLPRPDEVFGNGRLVLANLEVRPELSHNANFGPRVELRRTPVGDFVVDVNAFLRLSDRLIVLLGNDRFQTYQNVYKARGVGVENAVSWVSPQRWVSLDGTLTWQDVRNVSGNGAFGDFKGDRIPNRPYLFSSWGARVRVPHMPAPNDALEPYYVGRYVHKFYRGWESQGLPQFKQYVDTQVTHSLGLSWKFARDFGRGSLTFEIDNLTDAKVFDNFGVQRPGRAFYLKATGEI